MSEKQTILVVDDDESVTMSLSLLLKKAGYKAIAAYDPVQALELLKAHSPALVIHDMNFSRSTTGEEGLELLQAIRVNHAKLPVILITAWGSIDLAVAGMKFGANDFISKPWSNAHLLQVIKTALDLQHDKPTHSVSRAELDQQFDFSEIVGQDPKFLQILSTVGRISKTDAPVLILGESGTGKELIANALHQNSPRINGEFVKVNLGGVPGSLFESEMFGHVKGAFTDAKSDRQGRFEMAHQGSIFLDEIGDLDKSSQVKLLRVLQDQTYQAVGSSKTRKANVRVISATNCDLQQLVADGDFREDLLYRINLITLRLPPLRERPTDIPLIAHKVLVTLASRYGMSGVTLSKDGETWLIHQPWPGNIRQLTQVIERTVLMSGATELTRNVFIETQAASESQPLTLTQAQAKDNIPVTGLTLEEVEKVMIEKSLSQYDNNLTQVASTLGLTRQALYRRLEKYGISP
ncbi:MAG: sigma-54-dependent Fis family transcriptional regulator [Algicola sp.]|nr:sigma-54-dependent Fis family transcriptional regulator [Algicola sp.]